MVFTKLGYAFCTYWNVKDIDLAEMAESGLIIQKESDESYFDRFRGRIMFPIRDENGKVIAFSGQDFKYRWRRSKIFK